MISIASLTTSMKPDVWHAAGVCTQISTQVQYFGSVFNIEAAKLNSCFEILWRLRMFSKALKSLLSTKRNKENVCLHWIKDLCGWSIHSKQYSTFVDMNLHRRSISEQSQNIHNKSLGDSINNLNQMNGTWHHSMRLSQFIICCMNDVTVKRIEYNRSISSYPSAEFQYVSCY